jgi:hypothetical protein
VNFLRFKVKVNVKDDVEECVLVLFDYDVHYLLGKTCVQVIEETKVFVAFVLLFLLLSLKLISFLDNL